ncbi:DsbA family oxidoreductase [Phototrophicus methaneseepsis]|uniref:DsbA family oxidoreductase n=1 Tax=Phototrophicus methaneseepsis TaxID=2710758 RepID=A0A7S8E7N4_9CHLR|nr:DsbA family oxidoreductase [Phototrophicus methaneseepsis]QPC81866.1 DsbA family oxidoreductase [Phototrophicus methaneseepsis]
MKVEIWSDIACPWCYIGRRRFESALDQFEHDNEVEVVWRSFQLDPSAPQEPSDSLNDMLMKKMGVDRSRVEAMQAHVTQLAAQEGLEYHLDDAKLVNSMDAHRLIHLAAHHGLQGDMKERLQRAYFTEGLVVSDEETLVQLAVEVGLDAAEVREMLAGDAYAADVRADIRRAQMIGVNGVPFFVFDERYAISGAQPSDLFLETLERTWTDAHPIVSVIGADDDAGVCTDESCAI